MVNSVLFGLVSSVIAMVFMDFGVTFLRYDNELLTAFILGSVSLIPASCVRFLEAIFRAIEKSEFIALGQFMENVSKVILCVAVVLTGYGIVAISAMTVLTKLLALGLASVFLFQSCRVFSIKFKKDVWTMLLREAPTFMGIAIFSTIHLNVDTDFAFETGRGLIGRGFTAQQQELIRCALLFLWPFLWLYCRYFHDISVMDWKVCERKLNFPSVMSLWSACQWP